MELGLKTNIRYFAKYSGVSNNTTAGTHDLEKLFAAFRMHVEKTFEVLESKFNSEVNKEDIKSLNDLYTEVEALNKTFHTIDRNSDAFRYPVDKKHNPSFKNDDTINILDVDELLEKSVKLFLHTADFFGKHTDYANGIESEYES